MIPKFMTPKFTSQLNTRILHPARWFAAAAGAVLLLCGVAPDAAVAQSTPTLVAVRAMPAKTKKGETFATLPPLIKSDIAEVKVGGKVAEVTDFVPLLKGPHNLQLMVLLDSMEMIGVNGQFDEMTKFFHDMPPNVEIGIGYLLQGNSKIVQGFTTDRSLLTKALHQQTREEAANPKNDNGNPYSCLRQLAAHWPDPDPNKLRAVLVFTDGIIRNNAQSQGGDQLNPDVEGASQSLQRAGIVPYPFFYMDPITPDPNRSEGGQLEGQQNFSQLVANTGGAALDEGLFAPGSFTPLLNKLYTILDSEAVITVNANGKPGKFATLDMKSTREGEIKIFGPDSIVLGNPLGKK
jgi:hypothetical protein